MRSVRELEIEQSELVSARRMHASVVPSHHKKEKGGLSRLWSAAVGMISDRATYHSFAARTHISMFAQQHDTRTNP